MTAPSLETGQSLGPYRIISFLAAGGMGAVYRAHDPRTGRDVAIKVAAQQFSERFTKEVRAVAALNHPNICTLYDVGPDYLVMELVEGPTLADRIAAGPVSLDEAMPIAQQIAQALEEAHEKQIVHRDLKPGNVKITPSGLLKVLDFGLAQVNEPAGVALSHSPTFAINPTEAGMLLGTAAYMAPEQARGRPVDKRADIWAFGVVFYEMLTGEPLFASETVSDTIAAVLTKVLDFDRAPARARPLLRRCLERDPKKRLRDIGDAMPLVESEVPPAQHGVGWTRWVWPGIAAGLAVITALALWRPFAVPSATPGELVHFVIPAPAALEIAPRPRIAASPDGSRIVFTSRTGGPLHLLTMQDPVPKELPGTEDALMAAFSPNGDSIAFATQSELRTIPAIGGASSPVTRWDSGGVLVLSWPTNDGILLSLSSVGVMRVAPGGTRETILKQTEQTQYRSAQLLPGSKSLLVTAYTGPETAAVTAVNLATGARKALASGADAMFVPTGAMSGLGHLLFIREGSLFGSWFDTTTLTMGPEVPIIPSQRNSGVTAFDVSGSGKLVYTIGGLSESLYPLSTMVLVDRSGAEETLIADPGRYVAPRISPDGRRIAFWIIERLMVNDIWVWDLSTRVRTRATYDRGTSLVSMVWTPDSSHVIYLANRFANRNEFRLFSIAAGGADRQPVVLGTADALVRPESVSKDRVLIGTPWPLGSASRGNSFRTLRLGPDQKPVTPEPQSFLDDSYRRQDPQFSSDGKWVAFVSNRTDRDEIYVAAYPGGGSEYQVSTGGGNQPRWNPNGRELFFRNGNTVMAVAVETASTFRVLGSPRELFEKGFPFLSFSYDVADQGRRFLMLKSVPGGTDADNPRNEYHVVTNWFDELRRRVPSAR